MTMTQQYAEMLRRYAATMDDNLQPTKAEAVRQAARHMEELQAKLSTPEGYTSDGWQPIETAPKGREVLLWSTKYKQPISVGDWGSYCRMNQPCWTHWMEKPPAPVAAAAAKDKP